MKYERERGGGYLIERGSKSERLGRAERDRECVCVCDEKKGLGRARGQESVFRDLACFFERVIKREHCL